MKPMCQKSPAARALEETVAKSQARESARIQHEYFGSSKPYAEAMSTETKKKRMTLEQWAERIGWSYEDRDGRGKALYAGDNPLPCEATQAFEAIVEAAEEEIAVLNATKCGQGGRRRGPDENDMKPPTIEERAAKLGMSVVKDETEWLISDDVRGEILRGFPSRRAVSKWLDGAEAMAHIMEERLGAGL